MAEIMRLLLLLLAMSQAVARGGLTFYYGELFEGQPLYCGGRYREAEGPWLALPVEWYQSGQAHCGDLILVMGDGWAEPYLARAKDAGLLAHYQIHDSGLPFVADLPRYWRAQSDGSLRPTCTGWLINLSAIERAWQPD